MPEATIAAAAALLTVAVNGAAGAFAGLRWWQVSPSAAVWPLIRAGQAVAAAQALVAGGLAVAGYRPEDRLYWLYALRPVAIGVIAEQLRIASADTVLQARDLPDAQAMRGLPESEQHAIVHQIMRRELGVMTASAFVVAVLGLRAGGWL